MSVFDNVLRNWKTSGPAAVGGFLGTLQVLGLIALTPTQIGTVALGIVSIIGLFAKDGDKSGTA